MSFKPNGLHVIPSVAKDLLVLAQCHLHDGSRTLSVPKQLRSPRVAKFRGDNIEIAQKLRIRVKKMWVMMMWLLARFCYPKVVIQLLHTVSFYGSFEQLIKLSSHFELCDFVRMTEPLFKDLELDLNDEQHVLAAVFKHPILMQRPIITFNDKAIIAKPPEKILAFIA